MKEIEKGTRVMVTTSKTNLKIDSIWHLRTYAGNGKCFVNCDKDYIAGAEESNIPQSWAHIVPVDKFNFDTYSFDSCDDYGTAKNA